MRLQERAGLEGDAQDAEAIACEESIFNCRQRLCSSTHQLIFPTALIGPQVCKHRSGQDLRSASPDMGWNWSGPRGVRVAALGTVMLGRAARFAT